MDDYDAPRQSFSTRFYSTIDARRRRRRRRVGYSGYSGGYSSPQSGSSYAGGGGHAGASGYWTPPPPRQSEILLWKEAVDAATADQTLAARTVFRSEVPSDRTISAPTVRASQPSLRSLPGVARQSEAEGHAAGSGEQAAAQEERVGEEDPVEDSLAANEEPAAKAESLKDCGVGEEEDAVNGSPVMEGEPEVKDTPAVHTLAVRTSRWARLRKRLSWKVKKLLQ